MEASEDVLEVGKDTESCMQSGVISGIVAEMEGVIHTYKALYPSLKVVLSGGDTDFFAKRLKNSIFANSKFLLEGLNYLIDCRDS